MRIEGSKGKKGRNGKCPKCNYRQRIKTKLMMVCCSNCGRKSKRCKWLS